MISIKSLLFIVAVAAAGAAGLVARTQLWASMLVALALGILLLAGCRAWFAPEVRTFWGPFTVTGALYLAIVSLQPLQELHYNLPTTQLVVFGLDKLQSASAVGAGPVYATGVAPGAPFVPPGPTGPIIVPGPVSGYGVSAYAPAYSSTVLTAQSVTFVRPVLFRMATAYGAVEGFPAEARAFLWVGQSLWSLLLALVAGVVSSWLFRTRPAAA